MSRALRRFQIGFVWRLFRFPVHLSGNVRIRLCHRLAAVPCYAATQAHPVLVIRHLASVIRHLASAIRHSPLFRRHPLDTRYPVFGSAGPIRASLGHPIQRGPSFYCGKKDRHQQVTTERPHPTGGSCPREGHGKAGLIRILFSVCVGEFRGWSLIPRDPRLDAASSTRNWVCFA